MTVTLRPFQADLKREIYARWQRGVRNVLAVSPTGSGKTVLFSDILHSAPGASVAIAHRQELVSQISLALARNGVRHRIIGPKAVARNCSAIHVGELRRTYVDPTARCAVAGVDTLIRMDGKDPWFAQVGLWVCDEAKHLLTDNKWGQATRMFPNAYGLGVDATPCRADGYGLGRHADGLMDEMIVGPSMRDLIEQGFLTEYRIFAPPSDIDMRQVTISAGGDYSPPKLAAAVHGSHIVGDVVAHYLRIAPGKLGVTFAVDVAAASEQAAAFRQAGVPSEVVSAKTPDALRVNILRRFAAGEIKQLCNCDLFGEGFDLPAIEVVSMARPTASFSLYAQQFGRSMRIMDGKDCISRGSLILTDLGEVPIENITLDHKVWDGVNYVKHGGAVCKGVRDVIQYCGVEATPDHKVMTNDGWQTIKYAADRRLRLANTGVGGKAVRFVDNNIESNAWCNVESEGTSYMRKLRIRSYESLSQYAEATRNRSVPAMQSASKIASSKMVVSTMPIAIQPMQQSKLNRISKLRSARNSVQFRNNMARGRMDSGQHWNLKRSKFADRSNRQQRALRAGEFAMGTPGYKCEQLPIKSGWPRKVHSLPQKISRNTVRRSDFNKIDFNFKRGRNNRQVAPVFMQTEREVWDIYNAGPLQRFTANGRLVHNCAIVIDHVGNVHRHGLPDAPRIWTLDRRERRSRSTPDDVVKVRTCPECTGTYERVLGLTCPFCGHTVEPVGRSGPDMVDGDLSEMTPEALALLRGEIDKAPTFPYGAAPEVIGAIKKRHREKAEAQAALREAMAKWGGIRTAAGDDIATAQRRFYISYGIDVATAQTLGRSEAEELRGRIGL